MVVGQLATVVDGFKDVDMTNRFDGRNDVTIQVFRIGNEDTLNVARAAKAYIEQARGIFLKVCPLKYGMIAPRC